VQDEEMPLVTPVQMRTKTILVVDDNAIAREGLRLTLSRHGYRTAMAADGEQALGYLQNAQPDLVLLDMLMPGVDGWQFLAERNKQAPLSTIPVIVTTGTILTREWAQAHGCHGFLRKPFEENALLDEVERCLS
jgi:CheY-like chemotaxis protein